MGVPFICDPEEGIVASLSAVTAVHATLSANTIDTVTLTANDTTVEIVNRGSTDPLSATVGLTTAVPADPTVLGNDTYVVPAGAVRTVKVNAATTGTDFVVKVIAASGVAYSVQAGGQ